MNFFENKESYTYLPLTLHAELVCEYIYHSYILAAGTSSLDKALSNAQSSVDNSKHLYCSLDVASVQSN